MQLITISGTVMEDESRHSRNGFDFQFFKVCCRETRSDGKLLNEGTATRRPASTSTAAWNPASGSANAPTPVRRTNSSKTFKPW